MAKSTVYGAYTAAQANSQRRSELVQKNEQIKRQSDLALKKAGYEYDGGKLVSSDNSDAQVKEQQNAITMQRLKAVETQLAVRESDARITDFVRSGDANSLQLALDNNESLKSLYASQGVQMVGNIDYENDKALLKQQGVDLDRIPSSNKDLAKRSMFKYYDGKQWKVGTTDSLIAKTGMSKRVSGYKLDALNEFQAAQVKASKGITADEAERNLKIKEQAGDTKELEAKSGGITAEARQTEAKAKLLGTETDTKFREREVSVAEQHAKAAVRNAEKKATAKPTIDKTKMPDGSFKVGYDEFGKKGEVANNLARSEKVFNDLVDEHFDGDESKFYSTDLHATGNESKNAASTKAINKIRRLASVSVTGSDKKRLDDLTKLTALSRGASKLDKTDVGWFDDTVQQVGKYFHNNPKFLGNTEAKASYAAFQGILRVAMIGAAQTTSEMRNFSKMLGSQKLQHKPLLEQLDTVLGQVEEQYNTFSATVGNRAVAKILTGANIDSLKNSRRRIAKSLAQYDTSKKKPRAARYFKPSVNTKPVDKQPSKESPNKRKEGESISDYLKRTR